MFALRSLRASLPLLALLLHLAAPVAPAATFVVDADHGAVFDAIIDGVPFGPPKDGTPDQAGQALAVALKSGVTELRTVLELPLAALDTVASSDVVSATLSFNIDDVIGTFGPGFGFDGTAAHHIYAWAWAGDGAIQLNDFGNVVGPPAASVTTGPDGSITDTTLASTGPVVLTLDLTTALKARLDASSSHLGVTLATDDDGSATSLDDLGNSGAGPAGVNGSLLPVLTVVTAEADPLVLGNAALTCQKEIASQAVKLAATEQKLLFACAQRTLKAVAALAGTVDATAACEETLGSAATSKIVKARNKAAEKIIAKCSAVADPMLLGSPCDASAANFTDVAACVVAHASTEAQRLLRSAYGNACAIVTAVAVDDDYPVVCLVP